MGKKMLRVLCCGALICVVAGVSFAAENQYQKSVLKSKSVDYIKKLTRSTIRLKFMIRNV